MQRDDRHLMLVADLAALDDAVEHFAGGIQWRGAAAHHLDGQKTPANAHHQLAHAGGHGRSPLGIDVQAVSDDRRIAHPPRYLERHAAS